MNLASLCCYSASEACLLHQLTTGRVNFECALSVFFMLFCIPLIWSACAVGALIRSVRGGTKTRTIHSVPQLQSDTLNYSNYHNSSLFRSALFAFSFDEFAHFVFCPADGFRLKIWFCAVCMLYIFTTHICTYMQSPRSAFTVGLMRGEIDFFLGKGDVFGRNSRAYRTNLH